MYSLILVDYNTIESTIEYLTRCWEALGEKGAGHVVIVENGSNEGIPEKLSSLYGEGKVCALKGIKRAVYCYEKDNQQILYCHSGENLGYARGNNLGIEIVKAYFADDFYIVSNNDLVFTEKMDLHLADQLFMEHAGIGIIGPQIRTLLGEYQSPNKWESAFRRLFLFYWKPLIRLYNKLFGSKKKDTQPAQTGCCDWVSGCFMLLRAKAMEKAGLFDENTFLYAEEMILSRRMQKADYCTWYCDEMRVVHNHAQTTRKVLSALRAKDINFQSVYYYYKNYTDTSDVVLLLAKANYLLHRTIYWCANKACELLGIQLQGK